MHTHTHTQTRTKYTTQKVSTIHTSLEKKNHQKATHGEHKENQNHNTQSLWLLSQLGYTGFQRSDRDDDQMGAKIKTQKNPKRFQQNPIKIPGPTLNTKKIPCPIKIFRKHLMILHKK